MPQLPAARHAPDLRSSSRPRRLPEQIGSLDFCHKQGKRLECRCASRTVNAALTAYFLSLHRSPEGDYSLSVSVSPTWFIFFLHDRADDCTFATEGAVGVPVHLLLRRSSTAARCCGRQSML